MKGFLGNYFRTFLILICTFTILFTFSFQISQSLKVPSNGTWGIYHYYIGGKYLKELGYFNLYSCTIKANKNSWKEITKARDLRTYRIIPVGNLSKCPTHNFSISRWKDFSKDIEFITNRAPVNYWSNALSDKGFNAPPFWAAVAGTIARFIPLNNVTYVVLFNLDLIFIVITALIVWYGVGKIAGLLTLTLSLLYFGTLNIIGSNFLQYAWLPLLTGSFVLWNKKLYGKSGVVLGVATALQAFPVFFAVPVLYIFIISLIKKSAKETNPSLLFLKTFTVTLIFCFLVGSLYSGVSSWNQWSKKITIQKNYINGEIFDIGFPNLMGSLLSNDHSSSDTYSEDYIHTINRDYSIQKNLLLFYLATAVLVVLIFATMHRAKKINPMIFGYFIMYAATTLSPYYYLTLALIPFIFWNYPKYIKRFSLWGTVGLFGIHLIVFHYGGYVVFNYQKHILSEVLIITFFGILLFLLKNK